LTGGKIAKELFWGGETENILANYLPKSLLELFEIYFLFLADNSNLFGELVKRRNACFEQFEV